MATSEIADESVVETVQETVDTVDIDKIMELLQNAAKDAIETDDFLSYSTLLDIYLGNATSFNNEQRELLLGCLLKVLSENDKLTYEIGWDIPQLLMNYVESDTDFEGGIRKTPGAYKILKIFEVLALKGNPKELFLKCCELLTQIRITDCKVSDDINKQLIFFEVKLYCIFELVDACLKRIKTYYPSRFLGMVVASYINLVYENDYDSSKNIQFMLRRVYSFSRNYVALPLPDKTPDLTTEELEKIKSDEDYLQRKLLTGFITQAVHISLRNYLFGYSTDHFSFLQEPNRLSLKKYYDYQIDAPVMDRLRELALSFDINLSQEFKLFVADSHSLLKSVDLSQNEEVVTGDVFDKLITDYQKNLATTMVDQEVKNITVSKIGCFILFLHKIASSRTFNEVDVSFEDAVVITLRSVVPQMVEPSFKNIGMQDSCVFLSWYSLYQILLAKKNAELIISKIPKTFLTIYYQNLLHIIMFSEGRDAFRYVALTLLTKILALSPESLSYSFIKDTLENCPYDEKAVLIGVLKELLTKSKQPIAEPKLDDIEEKLANVNLDEKSDKAPPLPKREIKQQDQKYITLDSERVNVLFGLISKSISETFVEDNGTVSINPVKLSTLSGYLNLLVVLRNDALIQEKKELLEQIVKKVTANINKVKAKKDAANSFEGNAADILKITIDRINGN